MAGKRNTHMQGAAQNGAAVASSGQGDLGSFIALNFSDSEIPDFKVNPNEEYVRFGADDKYPDYLIYLLNKSPKHGAIIKGKTKYIFGKGMKAEETDPAAQEFVATYQKLVKKLIQDIEAFGMCYIQAIPTRGGGFGWHHVPYKKMRTNKENTLFFYKEDWQKKWNTQAEGTFKAFDPSIKDQATILMFKEYHPDAGVYGLPGFVASCNYIEADIEVSKHTLTNAQTGFSASKMINFFNGEPTEPVKRSIEARFMNKFGGSQGKKMIISFNNDPAKKPTVDDLGASDMTKEDFTATDNMIAANIYAGHEVTNPALFGIPPQDHSLGGNAGAELKISYDIFKETYVNAKQEQMCTIVQFMAGLNGVQTPIILMDVEPVGYTFSEQSLLQLAPKSWLLEKLGIDPAKYPDAAPVGTPAPAAAPVAQEAAPGVNSVLTNLTPKQHAQLERIIRQYKKGKITRETAALLLKGGLGVSDEDVNTMLGAQFNSDEDFGGDEDVALLFAVHGEPADGYAAYQKRVAVGGCFEAFVSDYSDVEDKIKIIRQAEPKATPAQIAKKLNIEEEIVKEYINSETKAAAGGTIAKLPKFEVRYSYELRPDVAGPELLETSRPFCKKMIGLNRLYTRTDIQKISGFLGYDVMLRSGGFWNNNGTIEYHCRHEFMSQIVIKKS